VRHDSSVYAVKALALEPYLLEKAPVKATGKELSWWISLEHLCLGADGVKAVTRAVAIDKGAESKQNEV
jgi:hypothetical protein